MRAFNETDSSLPTLGLRSFSSPLAVQGPGTVNANPGGGAGEALVQQTPPSHGIVKAPDTPHPPVREPQPDGAQRAFSRLNEAARRIAREDAAPNRRLPRASRLSPFRDISAEITRASTPLPNCTGTLTGRNSQEPGILDSYPGEEEQSSQSAGQPGQWQDLGQGTLGTLETLGTKEIQEASLPDFWPWLDNDAEEKEGDDIWANRTDPLITRHRPNSIEAALIEQEDIQRALAEGISTGQMPAYKAPRRKSPLRNIFIALAIFAIVALSIDGVLLVALSGRSHIPTKTHSSLSVESLALSVSTVNFGLDGPKPKPVEITISNFASNARVSLTHDLQEAIQMVPGAAIVSQSPTIVKIGANGSATAWIIVTTDWGFGYHTIYAEDIRSHNTASAGLLVIGSIQSQPARLEILSSSSSTALKTLDFGSDIQGANTTRQVYLQNASQSGSITWSASSNQPWLLISPNSGTFNQGQTIDVAVQRGTLPAGNYTNGVIKFYSNVDPPQQVTVTMAVTNPQPNSSVIALSPAALSFVTTDGSTAASCQTLTISNPGSQPLNYLSLTANAPALGISGNWLTASLSSNNSIPASSNQQVQVCAHSSGLLPGAYLGTLQITAPGAADSPQTVSVSLTVQLHCGLVTTSGFLNFTAVQGKTSAGSQSLGLNATASCNGSPLNWTAQVSTPSWLSVSPPSGQIEGTASDYLTVSVNPPAALLPRTQPYTGLLVFSTQTSTQTVLVSLFVQQPPPGAPIMSASPLSLNFSSTQGQNPKGQVVTITNSGSSVLTWNSSAQPFGSPWLTASPTSGQVPPGQTGTVTINVDTSNLTAGSYSGQVTLNEVGSPNTSPQQVVSVNLVVQPPCTLTQPSLSSLVFTGVQGSSNPDPQPVLITGTGNCAWPLLITATVSAGASWLKSPPDSSIGGNGQSLSLAIAPDISNLKASPQPYTAQITITATDSAGILAQGSGQTIAVSLTVEPPCTFVKLSPSNANLTFTISLGATSGTPQSVPLSEKGTCARPITYTVTPSSNAAWLALTAPSQDTGSGSSLGVTINATGMAPGAYSGKITITASDTNGLPIKGSLIINVTLNITPTVSGTVNA